MFVPHYYILELYLILHLSIHYVASRNLPLTVQEPLGNLLWPRLLGLSGFGKLVSRLMLSENHISALPITVR